jgi:hypothetical protein
MNQNTPAAEGTVLAVRSPVFIAGVARSGTTLLFRTLLKHSSFRPRNPSRVTRIVESKIFQDCTEDNPHIFHFMQDDDDVYKAFLEATRVRRAVQRLMKKLSVLKMVRRRSPRVRKAYAHITGRAGLIRTCFAYASKARDVKRMAEKTPIHGTFIPEIRASFSDAVMVWIHRHPVDAYSSYMRRGKAEVERAISPADDNRWLKVDPAEFCRRHRQRIGCLREALARRPLPIKVVSYEEFVRHPHAEFENLCGFLGEPYEAACVEGRSEEIDDPRDPLLSRPIVSTTKSWKDFLTDEQCRFIEDSLREDMEFLGYRPRVASW